MQKNKKKNWKKILLFIFLIIILLVVVAFFIVKNSFLKEIDIRNLKGEVKNTIEKKAMEQIGVVTKYDFKQGYYKNGRPDRKDIGVCTDVVGDALKDLGYDIRKLVFKDIKNFPKKYNDKPDININFRRAKDLNIYFKKYGKILPLDFKENLKEWKGGDIVIWKNHIGIISHWKRKDGLPYVISNHGMGVMVADILDSWKSPLVGHYRINKLISK